VTSLNSSIASISSLRSRVHSLLERQRSRTCSWKSNDSLLDRNLKNSRRKASVESVFSSGELSSSSERFNFLKPLNCDVNDPRRKNSWNDTRACGNKNKKISTNYENNLRSQRPEKQECLITEDDIERDFSWSKTNTPQAKLNDFNRKVGVFEYQEKHNRELREKDLQRKDEVETSVFIDKQRNVTDDISSHSNYSLANNVLTLEITDECRPLRSGQEITQGISTDLNNNNIKYNFTDDDHRKEYGDDLVSENESSFRLEGQFLKGKLLIMVDGSLICN